MAKSKSKTASGTPRKRKSTTKRQPAKKGFMGLSWSVMLNDALKPILFIAGIFAGKLLHDLMQGAVDTATNGGTAPTAGLAGTASAFLKPALLFAGGLVLKQIWKGDIGTYAGLGLAAYGGIVAAKEAFDFNVLGSLAPGLAGANLGLLYPMRDIQYQLPAPSGMGTAI